jgi:hypothetical protein
MFSCAGTYCIDVGSSNGTARFIALWHIYIVVWSVRALLFELLWVMVAEAVLTIGDLQPNLGGLLLELGNASSSVFVELLDALLPGFANELLDR